MSPARYLGVRTMELSAQELTALLTYLIKHNEDHAAEILELAERAQVLGNTAAYRNIVRGVDLLKESNKSLRAALSALEV
jgi:hypothetical protein